MWGRTKLLGVAAVIIAHAGVASAQPGTAAPGEGAPEASAPALDKQIAVMPLDALGMDPEPVMRLEALFRMELARLSGRPLPARSRIDRVLRRSRSLRRCGAKNRCLATIGKRLGVDVVVSGSVAALGDSYVVNIKAIDVATANQLERIETPPLRGRPDELIYEVRVAAYRLLAPHELRGSVMILSDLVGASVTLDGKAIGATPLRKPLTGLALGDHTLEVRAKDYSPFKETVTVRFQKTTRVVVRLAPEEKNNKPAPAIPLVGEKVIKRRPAPKRWYQSTWVYVGAGVTAAVLGGYIGYKLAHDPVVDCTGDPSACGM